MSNLDVPLVVPVWLPPVLAFVSCVVSGVTTFGDGIAFLILWNGSAAFGLFDGSHPSALPTGVMFITLLPLTSLPALLWAARKELRDAVGYASVMSLTTAITVPLGSWLLLFGDLTSMKSGLAAVFLVFAVVKMTFSVLEAGKQRRERQSRTSIGEVVVHLPHSSRAIAFTTSSIGAYKPPSVTDRPSVLDSPDGDMALILVRSPVSPLILPMASPVITPAGAVSPHVLPVRAYGSMSTTPRADAADSPLAQQEARVQQLPAALHAKAVLSADDGILLESGSAPKIDQVTATATATARAMSSADNVAKSTSSKAILAAELGRMASWRSCGVSAQTLDAWFPPISPHYGRWTTAAALLVTGAASGLLGGLIGTGAPPQMVAFATLDLSKESMRGIKVLATTVSNSLRLIMFLWLGTKVFSADAWPSYLGVAFGSIAGAALGSAVRDHFDSESILRMLYVVLFASCGTMFAQVSTRLGPALGFTAGGVLWLAGTALVYYHPEPLRNCLDRVFAHKQKGDEAVSKAGAIRRSTSFKLHQTVAAVTA